MIGPTQRAWLKFLLSLLISASLLGWLFSHVDPHAILATLQHTQPGYFLLALIFALLGTILLQAHEIHATMPPAQRPPVRSIARINLAMMFYALFLPTVLTFAIRWQKYRRLGIAGWDAAALVGVHKLLQLWTAAAFFFLAWLLLPPLQLGQLNQPVNLLGIIFALLSAYLIYMLLPISHPPAQPHRPLPSPLAKAMQALRTIHQLPQRQKGRALSHALLQHLCIVLSGWFALLSLQPDTPLLPLILARSLLVLLLTLPIAIAGIGVRELVFFLILPLYGIPAEQALSAALLLLAIQLLIAGLGGLSELTRSTATR